jgi:hypothetical protein
MIESGGKKIVFRIAGIGFTLDVASLIEVKELADVEIETSADDLNQTLLGRVLFRDDAIPVLDVRRSFGLPCTVSDSVLAFVFGSDGGWAFPIETVVGVALDEEFKPCNVSVLLQSRDKCLFRSINVWKHEPLISFEPALIEKLMVQV